MSMDLYTDCPECDGKGYDAGTMTCQRCNGSGIIPVRVKALEWQPIARDPDGVGRIFVAFGEDGFSYFIRESLEGRLYKLDVYHSGLLINTIATADSVDAIKSAYQSFRERMVMAMLEVP